MYIIKNALVNIKRNKGRNILIGLIIIVIAASCAVTLAIRESAEKIIASYEEQNKIEATISFDRESMMRDFRDSNKTQEEMIKAFNEIENIKEEEVIKYGDSNYLESYYYTYDLSVNAKDIKEATDSLVKETTTTKTETTTKTKNWGSSNKGDRPGMPPGGFGGSSTTTSRKTTTTKTEKIFNEKASAGAFNLIGYNSYDDMKDFINGNYIITSGEVSSDFTSMTCVISEELATLYKLEVGSKITIVDPKDSKKTYELEVTGIYKENTDSSDNMANMFTNSANQIITNVTVVKKVLEGNSELEATITPTYIVKDSESVELFSNEVKEKGLSSYYVVTSNLEDIENATESIKNVRVFATTFLIITLVIGGVVLVVINMINIRERKYEIGVLRTIGMKKSKLSMQFMFELLVVCIFALLLGAGIGSFTSVPIANSLLANEIENANSKYDNINNNFGRGRPTTNQEEVKEDTTKETETKEDENKEETKEEVKEETNNEETKNEEVKEPSFGIARVNQIDNIEAVVDLKVLGELLGIGILLTLIGSLASMIAISRFSPLTILKERG
jgi:putative ABC transport system permease protein